MSKAVRKRTLKNILSLCELTPWGEIGGSNFLGQHCEYLPLALHFTVLYFRAIEETKRLYLALASL